MRWVLMLFVILAAVMGGEARAVVVMGRAVVSERVGRAETVEKRAEALRVESERAPRVAALEVQKAAGLMDDGPLALWFPGGLAVARSDCGDRQAEFSDGTLSLLLARGVDIGGGTRGLLWTARRETGSAETGSTVTLRFNRYNSRGDVVGQSDAAGVTKWAASYQADGRRTGEIGTNLNPKQATGRVRELGVNRDRHRANSKEEDPTGLLNEGFRYRDLETGTFISRDPLGFVDGPNVYCYVGQNPWTMWDPEGLWGTDDHNAPAPTGIMRFFSAHHYAMLNARGYRVGRDVMRMNQLRVAGTKSAMVVPPVVAPLIVGAAMTAPAVAAAPEAAVAWAASRYPLATATTIATTTFLEATGQLPFALPSPKSRSFSGSQCFPAGTPVWTSDGSVCIESIRPGDVILTRSLKSGKPVACEVTRVFVHEYTGEFVTITLSGGECVTSTKNHPFRVLAGEGLASRPNSVDAGSDASLVCPSGARWVDAADLRLGDVTWTSNGPQAITGIIRDYRSTTVYNLGVSLERTYLVGESGVLVHNKTPDVDMGGGGALPRAYDAAEANPLELPGAGTVGAANSAVKPGQAGTYGELKEQKKAFGETEPLDMDHRPSYAAQVKAAEAAKGAPLSKAELAKLKANTQAVATPRADHQTKSRTYGGRNTDARSTADAADLDAAKAADDAAYR
jgi:RHS repeat-associated protein